MSLISDALMSDIIFYVVAFAMIATAIAVVLAKNLLQSAVFLIFSFIGTAVLYLLLHAEFNAMAQIMVYAGGVVIFVIFTILLTSRLGESVLYVKLPRTFIALTISAALLAMLVHFILPAQELVTSTPTAGASYASLSAFASRLLSTGADGLVIPFEIVSVLLLVTLVCAITIARKTKEEEDK